VLGLIGSCLKDELTISTSVVDDPDNVGRTPLFWAAYRGDVTSVSLLLQFGAKAVTRPGQSHKNTPLHAAARSGNNSVVRELLRHGAAVDSRGEDDMTPLFLAAATNDGNECIRVLIQNGADVSAEDCERRTAFLMAAQNGMLENTRVLLEHGADINKTAEDGWTALASCVFWNMYDSVLLLLEYDADHRIRTDEGDTLLHTAARYGDLRMIKVLTDAELEGMDADYRNCAGKTAQDIADERNDEGSEWKQAFLNLIDSSEKRARVTEVHISSQGLWAAGFLSVGQKGVSSEEGPVLQKFGDSDDEACGSEIFEDALESIIEDGLEANYAASL